MYLCPSKARVTRRTLSVTNSYFGPLMFFFCFYVISRNRTAVMFTNQLQGDAETLRGDVLVAKTPLPVRLPLVHFRDCLEVFSPDSNALLFLCAFSVVYYILIQHVGPSPYSASDTSGGSLNMSGLSSLSTPSCRLNESQSRDSMTEDDFVWISQVQPSSAKTQSISYWDVIFINPMPLCLLLN